MLQEKFRDLLEIMATFLEHQGYKQSRKKGEFHRPVSGKIIKLRMVLSSRMRGGRVGEIRIFLALEYPELEKIVSLLKEEAYQKGGNLFSQDIGLFCGERIYRSFCFSVDSDMEYVGMMIKEILIQNVFPGITDYEEDSKIIDKFQSDTTSWRNTYFSGGRVNPDFYIRWVALCILNGYIKEAFVILSNIPGHYGLEKDIQVIKGRLPLLCSDREQKDSFYLLIKNKIKINPEAEDIKRAINTLDGLHVYYMLVETAKQGSYLQIAGGSGEYTVEIRRRTDDGDCHCRAELKREEPEEKRILYGERELLLQKNQVLSIDKVYEIACKYLDQELQEDYFWRELDL